jgi:translation initiation factor 1 (eIF-1/SUI1)
MNKDIRITFRVTPEEYETIKAKADQAHMSVSAYVRAAALRHKVVVVDGLKEHTHELKGIGRSLNQLTILAHEGRISAVDLDSVFSALEKNYIGLCKLADQERR